MATEWSLKVPPGIDGEVARGLVSLLERWDNIGVEKVLVWHLPSVDESALPHLAQAMGVDRVAFIGGPPRELVKRGIDLMRRRGTPAAMQEAIEAFGYTDVILREGGHLFYDGSIDHGGEPNRYGADGHWATFVVWATDTRPAPGDVVQLYDGSITYNGDHFHGADAARARELWDAIHLMKPARCVLSALVRTSADGEVAVVRERP